MVEKLRPDRGLREGGAGGRPEVLADALGAPRDLGVTVLVGVGEAEEHLLEGGQAPFRDGREVGAAVERGAVGGEKDRHRPSAVARQGLDGGHVDRVYVRPLLAVDLDVDEVLVHYPRGLLVLEGLALHHVAPVARAVADREQDGLVLLARLLQRLLAPRKPVHGIVLVLKQVRARLFRKPVGHVLHLPPKGLPWDTASAETSKRKRTT